MRFAFASILALAACAGATTASARTLAGGGFVHNFTQACQPTNPSITRRVDYPLVTYVAGEAAGRPSELVFVYGDGSVNIQAESHFARAGTFTRGVGRSISALGFLRHQPRPAFRVFQRLVVQPLNAPIASAEQVYMRVVVRNWWGIEGCNVEAVLTLSARPAVTSGLDLAPQAAQDDGTTGALPPAP